MAFDYTQIGSGYAKYPKSPKELRTYFGNAFTNVQNKNDLLSKVYSGGNIIQNAAKANQSANADDISAYNMLSSYATNNKLDLNKGIEGLSDQDLIGAWDLLKREQERVNQQPMSGLSGLVMSAAPAIMGVVSGNPLAGALAGSAQGGISSGGSPLGILGGALSGAAGGYTGSKIGNTLLNPGSSVRSVFDPVLTNVNQYMPADIAARAGGSMASAGGGLISGFKRAFGIGPSVSSTQGAPYYYGPTGVPIYGATAAYAAPSLGSTIINSAPPALALLQGILGLQGNKQLDNYANTLQAQNIAAQSALPPNSYRDSLLSHLDMLMNRPDQVLETGPYRDQAEAIRRMVERKMSAQGFGGVNQSTNTAAAITKAIQEGMNEILMRDREVTANQLAPFYGYAQQGLANTTSPLIPEIMNLRHNNEMGSWMNLVQGAVGLANTTGIINSLFG